MGRILSFLSHRRRAKTRHGTHSPFVYQLVEKVIYGRQQPVPSVVHHFRQLRQSRQVLVGMDHGKGSPQSKPYIVGQLARASAARPFESALLSRLVRYHGHRRILELGTNIGATSARIAAENPDAHVTTVEGNAALADFARAQCHALGLDNVEVVHAKFESFFATLPNDRAFDMVFIDGDHRYAPTMANFAAAKKFLKGEGPIVLHDIYWSVDMHRAWRDIIAQEPHAITIDLYFFGLVYLRPQQHKEHFDIRFPKSALALL